jgi:activator of HSP90 ATPase
MAPAQVNA